jgi:GNAT superfamily N-acetyltransferase
VIRHGHRPVIDHRRAVRHTRVVLVRPAVIADAASAVIVLRASITELCTVDHHNDPATLARWLRNKTTDTFRGWLADPDNHLAVAELDAQICGIGALHRTGDLNLCYVAPGYQRAGTGRAVLQALEDQARRWGLTTIRLTSTATARGFYEHHGYQFAGESETPAFGLVRGYRYTKQLPAA